jgi:hypothetical protein
VTATILVVNMAVAALLVGAAAAHPGPDTAFTVAPTSAWSTSGDYATDVLGDPWDFSNDEDVPPIQMVGTENSDGIARTNDGWLRVASRNNSTIKLVRTWGLELPWGRDGQVAPVDAARYSRLSFSMCVTSPYTLNMAVHFWTDTGAQGLAIFTADGCKTFDLDLLNPSLYPHAGYKGPWSGNVTRLELLRGGAFFASGPNAGLAVNDQVEIALDWVRLRRPDAASGPPSGLPVARLLTPSVEGGEDYATANGNPWDFEGPNDAIDLHDIRNAVYSGGELIGQTFRNDGYVEFPLPTPFNPDRYHRFTAEVCFGGGMSFANAPGGGMNARVAWFVDTGVWVETQDIIVYPGCNRMSLDLTTTPAVAVNDETTAQKRGWRGQRISRLRFDLNEDPGVRDFRLREVKFADDAALSTTYPITFLDAANASGVTAELFATTQPGAFDGVKIAGGLRVTPGVNTFQWDGTTAAGATLPNGRYWIYVRMTNTAGVASGYATGPLRIEKQLPPTPSYYVPLNPSRILDTRNGTGGNLVALGAQVATEVQVAGVGGVPETGATAVVLNVTVNAPTALGYLTVWPSREPMPVVSSLNFTPGLTVPNLVTVKLGANGKVNVFNPSGASHVIADVVGYYTATSTPGGRFTAVTPGRVLDTRNGTGRGGLAAPVGPNSSIDVLVTGLAGVPASGVSAVALNVTVDQPTATGYLTVWPTGSPQPLASSHNFTPGATVANLVLAKVGTGGRVSIYNPAGTTHVVADVVGYFSSQGGLFVPVTPARVVDTRDGRGGWLGPLGPGTTLTAPIAGVGGVPGGASAAVVNVTSADSSWRSYVTVWPAGENRPEASTLNPRPGVAVPNAAYAKLGADGQLSIYNDGGSTHMIVDVFGYIL